MKTAMQELIDELDLSKIVNRDKLIMVKYIISACLEKEKEQIINAYDYGYKACDLDEALEINKTMFSGDRYYNQTYNQNK